MSNAVGFRFSWVLADPDNEHAVDPLGLSAQADRIADFLLPHLSVQTARARYLSFLCWAVQKSQGSSTPVATIHRLEAELALEEARHHGDLNDNCPGVVGRLNALRYLKQHDWKKPARPERLYKNTAFAAYRPLMRSLGLLSLERVPELTPEGKKLAAAFGQSRGRKPRCLSDTSSKEQVLIRGLLGLDYRKKLGVSAGSARRRATFEAIGKMLANGADSAKVLEDHAQIKTRTTEVTKELHRAFVWELLSSGLSLAFSMLLVEQRKAPIVRSLRAALGKRLRRPILGLLRADDPNSAENVVSLLRTAIRLKPERLGLDHEPARLAEILVVQRDPDSFLKCLVDRHQTAKGGDQWIAFAGDKIQAAKVLGFQVRPRSYRLDAFKQLLMDLKMIL